MLQLQERAFLYVQMISFICQTQKW